MGLSELWRVPLRTPFPGEADILEGEAMSMSTNRRAFLQQLGAAGIVSLGISPPAFLSRAAWAADAQSKNPTGGRVLVLVQMAGGNDGLNTVIPHGDPEYYKARPGIGIPAPAVLKIDDGLGFHPQMTG